MARYTADFIERFATQLLTPTEVMRGQMWCGSCTAEMMMVPAEEIAPMNSSVPDARANMRKFRKTLEKHFGQMAMWEEE